MIKNPLKYISIFFLISILAALLLFYFDVISQLYFNSAMAAIGLNFINSFAAFWLFQKSYQKSNSNYMLANLGGMVARMLFLLAAVVVTIIFLNIEKIAFILLFFIFYFILLAVEVVFFVKKVEEKKESRKTDDVI